MRIFAITSILASIVASAGVLGVAVEANVERSVSNVQAVTIGDYTITITTVPVTPARLAKFPAAKTRNRSSPPQTSLTKRVVGNGCEVGCGGNGPNFTVPPGFEQIYSLGTCAVGLINFNPVGGPDVAFCHYLMAGTLLSLFTSCITNLGFTGSICFSNSNNLGVNWGLEVRHV
ncbi:hypothetical protein PTI98_004282 [Pleurotus ostreatus]|nr:hypothetical protein PTI98_004282 [Pleurotus ostreatus]